MKLKSIIAAAGLMLASAASQAGVIYEWVTIDDNALPIHLASQIEVDVGAVQRGSLSLRLEPGKPAGGNAGFYSFRFGSSVNIGHDYGFPANIGYFDINVSFVENGRFLTGSISASNFSDRVNLSSNYGMNPDPRVFTLYDTNGDGLLGCGFAPRRVCEGATGYFRQVPEPASAALLGLGLIGVLAARRRKRK